MSVLTAANPTPQTAEQPLSVAQQAYTQERRVSGYLYCEASNAVKARLKLPTVLLEADRLASQLCRYYQIRNTHDGVMVWRFRGEWEWCRPFPEREQAEEYLAHKLPDIDPTPGDLIKF